MQQLNSLDSAISRLLVVFEKYPELKSIEQYNRLSAELQRTENRVQIARSDYNSLVRSYNILVEKFPNSILANWFGFRPEKFFESQVGTDNAPKLNMD
jgi:LemA protein